VASVRIHTEIYGWECMDKVSGNMRELGHIGCLRLPIAEMLLRWGPCIALILLRQGTAKGVPEM